MPIYQISLLIAVGFAIIEVLTFTFLFLSFSIGMMAVALSQYLFAGLSWSRDIVIFSVVSVLAVVFCRLVFKKRTDQIQPLEDDVNRY